MSLSVRVKEVTALDNLKLNVDFENGISKLYDVKTLLKEFPAIYSPLKDDEELFKKVHIICGGCGIAWNEDIDISECELWENGVQA